MNIGEKLQNVMKEDVVESFFVRGKEIELAITGSIKTEDIAMFANRHICKCYYNPQLDFLIFAKNWFDCRGYATQLKPIEKMGLIKSLMNQFKIDNKIKNGGTYYVQ